MVLGRLPVAGTLPIGSAVLGQTMLSRGDEEFSREGVLSLTAARVDTKGGSAFQNSRWLRSPVTLASSQGFSLAEF